LPELLDIYENQIKKDYFYQMNNKIIVQNKQKERFKYLLTDGYYRV